MDAQNVQGNVHGYESALRKIFGHPQTCVRFTDKEYNRIQLEQRITGKSIPWLLRNAYFKGPAEPPSIGAEIYFQAASLSILTTGHPS